MTTVERPVIGVLGGMGPLATADFYAKVVSLTPAVVDQDHVRMVIWADPTIPDRSSALLDGGVSPLTALTRGLTSLETAGADVIAIPCNTAHAYLEKLREVGTVPILDMVELAVADAMAACPGLSRLGVLATRGTHAAQLYERRAATLGLELVLLAAHQQRDLIDRAIVMIKSGRDLHVASTLTRTATLSLRDHGAQAVIAGCSEIPLVTGLAEAVLPIVDATSVLARTVVEIGGTEGVSARPTPSSAEA